MNSKEYRLGNPFRSHDILVMAVLQYNYIIVYADYVNIASLLLFLISRTSGTTRTIEIPESEAREYPVNTPRVLNSDLQPRTGLVWREQCTDQFDIPGLKGVQHKTDCQVGHLRRFGEQTAYRED